MPETKVPGLSGIPKPIVEYYLKMGLPGDVVSVRQTEGKVTSFVSIRFRDCPNRHAWADDNRSTRYARYRSAPWVLEILPL